MIPDTITLGHVLMLAGLLIGLYGLWQLLLFVRYRGPEHGQGTPGYARRRDARRYFIVGLAAGAILIAAGCFSPLCDIALAGGGG